MAKTMTNDYPCIRAWERMFGAGQDYVQRQLEKAREENAPADAIYKRSENAEKRPSEWARLSEVSSVQTRWYFKNHHPELVEKFCQGWD